MWRIYRPAWVSVYVSTRLGPHGERDCLADFSRRWAGHVQDEDWQILVPEDPEGWVSLQLRLPVLAGEHEDEPAASLTAGVQPGAARVVRAGSDEEHELQGYGRRQA
jgi:hypothetical protein